MRGRERSFARSIRGPVTLITLGVLFALNNFTDYRFDQTWPVLLIVFGLLTLLGRGTEPVPPPVYPAPGYPPPPNPYPAGSSAPPGGYAQSSYSQPQGASKGGFGASAPGAPKSDPGSGSQGGAV
jgi:hypothetical protein